MPLRVRTCSDQERGNGGSTVGRLWDLLMVILIFVLLSFVCSLVLGFSYFDLVRGKLSMEVFDSSTPAFERDYDGYLTSQWTFLPILRKRELVSCLTLDLLWCCFYIQVLFSIPSDAAKMADTRPGVFRCRLFLIVVCMGMTMSVC